MNADHVNKIVEAMLHILKTTASVTLKAKDPYLKKERTAYGAVSGVIHISGEFKGTVAVSFSEKLILHIVSTMFGETLTKLNDEVKDAVGEITNMISGQATIKLNEAGNAFKAALGAVEMGKDHPLVHLESQPVIAMPYSTEHGDLVLEVCFEKK